MRFSDHFLDELRTRVPLVGVIGRTTKLTRKGREHQGLCPFHNEKTPSFTVVEEKGFYHCFGCGAHGDVIRFVMEQEGLSFPETVERLALEAGMELPQEQPGEREAAEQRKTLYEVMETCAGWYQSQLGSTAGKKARDYIDGRGLKPETVETFEMGFAPDSRTALKQAMIARKITEAQLIECGMLIKPEDGGASYDRFRDRLMFPIRNRHGKAIAFGGRALGDQKAKYLNSPETPLFHKGRELYNAKPARRAAFDAGRVVVVEGYMDVIALHEAGVTEAVAPNGTALTEDQIAILWRYAPEPVLCFDGDKAGVGAAHRAAERALPHLKPGLSLRFALMPEGDDPDTLFRREGRQALENVLSTAVPLSDLIWQNFTEHADLATPERKAGLRDDVFKYLGQIGDDKVKTFYMREFGNRLDDLFAFRRNTDRNADPRRKPQSRREWRPAQRRPVKASPGLARTTLGRMRGSEPVTRQMEELIVLTVLNHPELLGVHFEAFAEVEIRSPDLDKLRAATLGKAAETEILDIEALKAHLLESGQGQSYRRLIENTALRSIWSAWPDAALADAEQGWLHVLNRHTKVIALNRELRAAEQESLETGTDESARRVVELTLALGEAKGDEAGLEGYGLASGRAEA